MKPNSPAKKAITMMAMAFHSMKSVNSIAPL